MKSILNQYIELVINPLERFRKKLMYRYNHISGSEELLEMVEKDLFQKYKKLEELIDEEVD